MRLKPHAPSEKATIGCIVSHPSPNHPTDEDQSLHPSEQKSFVGDPESVGAPVARWGTALRSIPGPRMRGTRATRILREGPGMKPGVVEGSFS